MDGPGCPPSGLSLLNSYVLSIKSRGPGDRR
jgi:hypothetical protein